MPAKDPIAVPQAAIRVNVGTQWKLHARIYRWRRRIGVKGIGQFVFSNRRLFYCGSTCLQERRLWAKRKKRQRRFFCPSSFPFSTKRKAYPICGFRSMALWRLRNGPGRPFSWTTGARTARLPSWASWPNSIRRCAPCVSAATTARPRPSPLASSRRAAKSSSPWMPTCKTTPAKFPDCWTNSTAIVTWSRAGRPSAATL